MKKTLIAYFTRTGITKKLAEDTAKQTGADLFAIEPVKEYSSSYLICVGQAKLENLQDYDTIVVMFPIWWFTCPNIILTFLEENDLSGKTVIPVCTYGSSGKGSSEKAMTKVCKNATFKPCIEATGLKDKAVAAIAAAIEEA
ncbi:flavodoxin [Phascolarctobacterium succinatutens]|uniref:flavodoxin n=1 Tax=Phascolarctobacterium succinatutens TaxID=626940 RepID=UPI003AAA50FA